MKHLLKLLILLLVFSLTLGMLVACADNNDEEPDDDGKPDTPDTPSSPDGPSSPDTPTVPETGNDGGIELPFITIK
ncbi:MAG: hypothetical protein J6L90_00160 [Clostridia bacterium]|nr:hypothetical protein [Clostridia bacterium]